MVLKDSKRVLLWMFLKSRKGVKTEGSGDFHVDLIASDFEGFSSFTKPLLRVPGPGCQKLGGFQHPTPRREVQF